MRVLYIDDDRINTLLFEEACRLAPDLEVATAATGAEALDVAGSFQPDVLVVDLHLPDTTGYDLLPQLRLALGHSGTPAFLCTADEMALVGAQAAEAGFRGCWSKPVELGSMLGELARLGHQPTPPGAAQP